MNKKEIVDKYVKENIIYYNSNIHSIILSLYIYTPFLYIIYNFLYQNSSFLTNIIFFSITYFFDNLGFMIGHMNVHKNFMIYIHKDNISGEKILNQFTYIAYLHHYYNPYILSMMPRNFLLIYLGPTVSNVNKSLFIQNKYYVISMFLYGFICNVFMIYNNFYITIISIFNIIYFDKIGLSRISFWYMIWLYYYSITDHFNNSLLFLSYVIINNLLQSLSHNWYHTYNKDKYEYYGFFLFYLSNLMEFIGIFDNKEHHNHHKHQIDDMNNVETFNNMYMPRFIIKLYDKIWKNIYEKDMKTFTKIIQILSIIYLVSYYYTIYCISLII